jgi:hypothetical protein
VKNTTEITEFTEFIDITDDFLGKGPPALRSSILTTISDRRSFSVFSVVGRYAGRFSAAFSR